ncbi:MAG: anti-sigma factor domain-containing protein [Clostridiales bacterium]|nr:anti-sigma factor domain-containing protein [Clostridiales bacterium]
MKTKGLVMEVQKNTVVVLTKDGRFCRLPRSGSVQVGEEYAYGSSSSFRPWFAVAAVLMLALASILLPLTNPAVPAAYVTIDINPSLELTVSTTGKVIAVDALNNDGQLFLQGLKIKKLPLDVALRKIFQAAEEQQYFDSDSLIVITSTPVNEEAPDVSEVIVLASASYLPPTASPVAVTVVAGTKEMREEAQELGLSTGKYAIYLAAEHEGLSLIMSELQEKGIGRALLDMDVHPGEFLRRVDKEQILIFAQNAQNRMAAANKQDMLSEEDDGEEDEPGTVEENTSRKPGRGNQPDKKTGKPETPAVEQPNLAQANNNSDDEVSDVVYGETNVSNETVPFQLNHDQVSEEFRQNKRWNWGRIKGVFFPGANE